MDGAVLPKYSSLNGYVNQPLLNWAGKIMDAVSDELNDQFSMVVVGTAFERAFFQDLQRSCDDCAEYIARDYAVKVDLWGRFYDAQDAAPSLNPKDFREQVYSTVEVKLNGQLAQRAESAEDASVCVVSGMGEARSLLYTFPGKMILCPSAEPGVTVLPDGKYLWRVDPGMLSKRLTSVLEWMVIPRFIAAAQGAAAQTKDTETQEQINKQTAIAVQVTVGMEDEVLEGETLVPSFRYEGEAEELPQIRMESSNPRVLVIRGNQVTAVAAGTAEVRFYRDAELDPFAVRVVTALPDNLIKKIILSAPGNIREGKEYTIGAEYAPKNAPDIADVQWKSDHPEVAAVEAGGVIRAAAPGKAVITASTKRVSTSVEIEVLPGVASLNVEPSRLKLVIGQKKTVELQVTPADSTEEICVESSDPKVAEVTRDDQGNWVIRGKGIQANGKGSCTVTFTAKESETSCECHVSVESTMNRNQRKDGYLARTALLVLAAFVMTFFGGTVGTYGPVIAGGLGAVFAVVGIIGDRQAWLWELILLGTAILIVMTRIV